LINFIEEIGEIYRYRGATY